MDEIQTYLGADGLMHCTVCKEPVEAFYPKGSLLEMKKHHRQCACERQAYAEEAQYYKEKELVITAVRPGDNADLIKEVKLNGKKHAGYRISHEELVHAGKIEFILK